MSCLSFAINIYDKPREKNRFGKWIFRRGGRYRAKRIMPENCIEQSNARYLIAMWIARCKTMRNGLDFTEWDLLWRWALKGRRENFPLAEQALAQRHDDKSSARTTSGCCGHPSETQSFPISRATGLKNVTEKERRENGGKNDDGGRGGNAATWIIAATLSCEFNRTYCREKCFASAPVPWALHFRVQLYPRVCREKCY